VIAASAITTGFQPTGRNHMILFAGQAPMIYQSKQNFEFENQTTCMLVCPLNVGDPISFSVQPVASTNSTADAGFLIVARLGRI
jgi:hypothetical protein